MSVLSFQFLCKNNFRYVNKTAYNILLHVGNTFNGLLNYINYCYAFEFTASIHVCDCCLLVLAYYLF